ncbi:MAG: thiopurine S-methyltransferase [Pseudomonadota bacterium]
MNKEKVIDDAFWHTKWETDQLGFHQEKVNSRLQKYWPELQVADDAKVFVPLCGKSLDMLWLAQHHRVIGNELSEIAVTDFFAEHALEPEKSSTDRYTRFAAGGIELLCGDYFALEPMDLKGVGGVFDRASLIALPAVLRKRYAKQLAHLLPESCKVLLITMIYDESRMQGPPFSVSEDEVYALFESEFSVQRVAQSEGPDIVGNLSERGLDTLTEQVFVLTKLPSSA